jgi:heme/copper-type cytochrome/quinol oxidase subunit 1
MSKKEFRYLKPVNIKPLTHPTVAILTKKPHNLLWIGALLTLAISLISGNAALDYTPGDTYYVISYSSIYLWFALLLIIFWVVYLLTERLLLSKMLTVIHILATLLPVVIFFALAKADLGMSGIPRRYYAITAFNASPDYQLLVPYLAIIAAFLIAQVCFLVNLVGGLVKYFIRVSR